MLKRMFKSICLKRICSSATVAFKNTYGIFYTKIHDKLSLEGVKKLNFINKNYNY